MKLNRKNLTHYIIKKEEKMNRIMVVSVSCLLLAVLASCAVSPGRQIGESGCDCLKKNVGNKEKMQECLGLFQVQIMEEMKRQNSLGTNVNKDADEAFQLWKKCSDEVMGVDSSNVLPAGQIPLPPK